MTFTRLYSLVASMVLLPIILLSEAQAQSINVAVASNFIHPMRALVSSFEKQSSHRVKASFGSSGKFYAQVKHGAPYQVFLSADQAKPIALEKDGFVVANSRFTFATGRLALWSSKENFIDKRLIPLKTNQFNKLALANPKLAPYGAAAIEVLKNIKLDQATQSKWVKGENIAQTFQFVSTGNSDLGFVALSQIIRQNTPQNAAQVASIKQGSAWIIPSHLHQAIAQDAVLLTKGENNPAAHEFMQFLKSPQAQKIINAFGYETL